MKYTFSYKIEKDDYYQYNRYHVRNSAFAKRRRLTMRILLAVIFVIAAVLFFITDWFNGEFPALSIAYLVVGLGFCIFFNQLTDLAIRRSIKKMQKTGKLHYDKEITYEFYDDFFREIAPDMASEIKYSIITDVAEGTQKVGNNTIYLYINVQQAHIVPLRVFRDEQERVEFLQFIKGKVEGK